MVQWWRVKISKMNFKLNALRLFVISAIISAHIVDTADNVTEMDSALVLQNASLTAFPMSFAVHRRAYAKISYGRGYPISLECDGSEYYGWMAIGEPPQNVKVLFDSGSSNMWVLSSRYRLPQLVHSHHFYDNSKSTTYRKIGTFFRINYVTGSAEGFLSQDTIWLAGLPVMGQVFAEARHLDRTFTRMKYDGLVGLAFTSVANHHVPVPLDLLQRQGVIKRRIFSFCLYRSVSGKKSVLLIGGSDDRLYHRPMHIIPLSHVGFWQFRIHRIRVGDRFKFERSVQAIVDSGTTMIAGPRDKVDALNGYLRARRYRNGDSYIIRCSRIRQLPIISFEMIDIYGVLRGFPLTPRQYVRKGRGGTYCMSGFEGIRLRHRENPRWTLGQVFMQTYYTLHDMDRGSLGLAKTLQ